MITCGVRSISAHNKPWSIIEITSKVNKKVAISAGWWAFLTQKKTAALTAAFSGFWCNRKRRC
jgi:hypothetical protein